MSCASLAGRSNLIPLGYWCFQLDSSHPDIAASAPPCEQAYITSDTLQGGHMLCWLDTSARPL